MKYFLVILLFYYNHTTAQVSETVKLYHYALDKFSPGTVKMKSGKTYSQVLNYNILTSEMIFNNGSKYLAIANPENVDTVYIDNRKFIPLNNKFYEVLVDSGIQLLLDFTYTISEPGTSVGYGSTSNTTPTPSIKYLINSGGVYNLKLPDDFNITPGYTYWIRKDGEMEKFSNAKQLAKIFPGNKEALNDLIKKNNTSFSSREDLILLIQQLIPLWHKR